MQNFEFYNPVKILFGKGQIANISHEIPAKAKVLMTYGGGSIKRNGVYEQVKAALSGRRVWEFGGIEPNPRYETLMNAVEIVRAEKIDFLLAVGGGSVGDGTKFIAAAAPFKGNPWDIVAKWPKLESAVPLGMVITLPATGTEMNTSSVISRLETQEKLHFSSELVYPRFSVLDPVTTFSLPARQVANGITDAYIHVMEQYMTYPANAPLQDRFAEGILQTLIEVGPKTLGDPTDYGLRASFMWAATMALNGLIGMGVPQDWATHMIGHELTALHGLDHAQTLAIVLPALLEIKRDAKREKLLQYGERVWNIQSGSPEERISSAISCTRSFFECLGIKTRLSDYGIGAETIKQVESRITALLKARRWPALGERLDITAPVVRQILEAAL